MAHALKVEGNQLFVVLVWDGIVGSNLFYHRLMLAFPSLKNNDPVQKYVLNILNMNSIYLHNDNVIEGSVGTTMACETDNFGGMSPKLSGSTCRNKRHFKNRC